MVVGWVGVQAITVCYRVVETGGLTGRQTEHLVALGAQLTVGAFSTIWDTLAAGLAVCVRKVAGRVFDFGHVVANLTF